MKKKILFLFCIVFFTFGAFSQVLNKTQLIKPTHWVYDALAVLEEETKRPIFIETAPITAGEIEFYFKTINRESLSDSGKALYDEIDNFLHSRPFGFYRKDFSFAVNPYLNPEFYYKSNKEIPWSFDYYFKDNLATAPIRVGVSDYFTGEFEMFVGKNYTAAQSSWSFFNVPLAFGDSEFVQPTWAYGSTGITFERWGASLVCAKQGLRVGNTLLGSIVYNNTFETQSFVQLNVYSPYFKYNLDAIQVNTNKYIYLHHFDVNFFNRLKVLFIEGSLITGPFEFKNLNPFMIMHSFGLWGESWSNDKKSAQYMAFLVEFCPTRNFKIYGLYAQNEITAPYESDKEKPSSLGFQLGLDLNLPSKHQGLWTGTLEGIWTMPYLYVKQTEANTFYSNTSKMHGEDTLSWMGSPFGPDCLGFALEAGYEMKRKWSVKLGYSLIAHGDNNFKMITEKYPDDYSEDDLQGKYKNDYYPAIIYKETAKNEAEKQKALDDAEYLFPSGIVEFTQRIKLSGSYYFNKYAQLNAQFIFTNIINCKNEADNTQNGVELALSVKCEIL